ncbi:MAG: hypothetical protein K8R86_00275, partial [Bacteroidales bacterium]|nr:hypothetical protein [Bacteroidales bacterium]
MNFNLVTEYPFWFIIICIALGLAYAIILYYKESKNEFSNLLKVFMAVFRAMVITIIAFLLLNPLIKTLSRFTEKPVIIYAQDNSLSLVTGADSNYYKTEYQESMNNFLNDIASEYKIEKYAFGDGIDAEFKVDFTGKQTDFSILFHNLNEKYSHKNVGALILASDGIYNKGLNPLYSSTEFDFPIYTVALGDTNVQKDIIINKINYNRIVYLGNEFPLEVIVNGNKCKGLNSRLMIYKDDSLLFQKRMYFNSENHFETVKLKLKSTEAGIQRYRVKLTSIEGEISTANNYQDIFIDVLEGRQKILLLANSPHPDISAIRQVVQLNRNYEIEDFIIEDFDREILSYNLLILHGLPSAKNPIQDILDKVKTEQIPVLYILTQQTSLTLFNKQKAGISIGGENVIYNEALPVVNDDFSLFELSDGTSQTSMHFSPLISPYGNMALSPSTNTFLYQKIGIVRTNEPLFLFNQTLDTKAGVILGSGIWKWRMMNFSKEGNHDAFNEIINKTIQYLSIKVDKSFFRVFNKNNFFENEDIEFDAEVYNESYELITDPEVTITITASDGKKYPFVFYKTSDS